MHTQICDKRTKPRNHTSDAEPIGLVQDWMIYEAIHYISRLGQIGELRTKKDEAICIGYFSFLNSCVHSHRHTIPYRSLIDKLPHLLDIFKEISLCLKKFFAFFYPIPAFFIRKFPSVYAHT